MDLLPVITIGGLAVFAAAGWVAAFAVRRVLDVARAEVAALKASPPAAALAEAAPVQPAPEPARALSRWHAMAGQRLELEDTGFYIVLDVRPNRPPYQLFAPEHTLLGYGPQLPALKAYGEQLAAERQEFAPPAPLAPFWRVTK